MNSRAFYQRQRGPNVLYALGLGFFGLMTAAAVVAGIWGFIDTWGNPEYLFFGPVMLVFTGFFFGFFLYIKVKIGRRRRRTYEKFAALSEPRQMEVNTELGIKFHAMLWGANRIYIGSGFFWEFIDYDEITWIHPSNTINTMVFSYEGVSVDATTIARSVDVYDREGVRYKIPTSGIYDTQSVIEAIKWRVPDVIYGYSKKWARLAKEDYDEFLREARKEMESKMESEMKSEMESKMKSEMESKMESERKEVE